MSIYMSIALSGLTAISAEVIWTRFLALSFGATVYTFSLILAAILVGLGTGSAIGGLIQTRTRVDPRTALGSCQMLVAVAIAWASFVSLDAIPFGVLSPSASSGPWGTFRWDFFRALVAVLPGAVLWGASFPLGLASLAVNDANARQAVSRAYAANTLGAIVGSVGTGLLFANSAGSHLVQQLLILVAGVSGALALMARTHVHTRYSQWVATGVSLPVLATASHATRPARRLRSPHARLIKPRGLRTPGRLSSWRGASAIRGRLARARTTRSHYHAEGKVRHPRSRPTCGCRFLAHLRTPVGTPDRRL
jgi:hypothetical protein